MARRGSGGLLDDGPQPKHSQLTAVLADLVVHELQPGAAIPSERELMTTHAVSRATVRKAIETLITEGLLHRVAGKGTFVTRPRMESRLRLASFSEDMRRRGLTPSTHLLGLELSHPPGEVASDLKLGDTGEAWRVNRVRMADDQPIAVESGWYPRAVFPDLDRADLAGSLYTLFADAYGVVIDGAEQTLWGEAADGPTARVLDAPLRTPLLVFRRVSRAGDRPVEHVVSRYRADRYQIHMTLGRDEIGSSPTTEGKPQ